MISIQDDVTGVDPSVFRRYFREEEEEVSDDCHDHEHDDHDHDDYDHDHDHGFITFSQLKWIYDYNQSATVLREYRKQLLNLLIKGRGEGARGP